MMSDALYQQVQVSNGAPVGSPAPLPILFVGLSDATLADLSAGLDPCPADYIGYGFLPVAEPAGRYVNKERFGDLLQPPVLAAITNLRKLAAKVSYPIGGGPSDPTDIGLLAFEQGCEVFDRAEQVNLLDARLPLYLQAAAQLHAFDGYDVSQEIARVQNNLLP